MAQAAKEMDAGGLEVNYFVATLGLAAEINKKTPHDFKTINQFFDRQASRIPHHPAIGFPSPPEDVHQNGPWDYQIFCAFGKSRLKSADTMADCLSLLSSTPPFYPVCSPVPYSHPAEQWR